MRFLTILSSALLLVAAPVLAQEPEVAADGDHDQEEARVDDIVVQATRSNRRVGDEPIRVEVINQEEIEEKLLMRPGSIAMLLSETGGLRVQTTSPSSGAANVRVQGMRGRYTQLLADGLPLYGGQASSLGLLQIAPSDLGQVEVIKGSASALYGPSALGGVINLVSKRPRDEAEGELILNATTRNGQDVTAYGATPLGGGWSASLLAGAHAQSLVDLDEDGWGDIPGHERWQARPRLFWDGADGSSLFATVGLMGEDRRGGTLEGRTAPDGLPFRLEQDTRRRDLGLIYRRPVGAWGELQLRGAATEQDHDHLFGDVAERDRHRTLFAEASLSGGWGATDWLAGLAAQEDAYRSETFPAFNYSFRSPALFGQLEHELTEDLTLAASARYDDHSAYGGKFSPRLSALYRPGDWTFRASWGRGFFAPTPFVEEVETTGLSRVEPVSGLKAETAETASLEAAWRGGGLETSLILFASDIQDAVRPIETTAASPYAVRLINAPGETRTRGAEALLRYRWDSFVVTGSYVYTDASEPDLASGRRKVPLTPRHTAGLVAMWEEHDRGRIGLELYYTGEQALEDNPYRTRSRPYLDVGLLGEVVLGRVRLFLNLENVLNVRQTRWDPLLLPARARDGRWTVDGWAPTEGFVANAGVRLKFGGGHH